MSSRGGAPDVVNSAFGKGDVENCAIDGDQLLVMRMSMSCDGATAALIEAKEVKFSCLEDDFVSVCDSSLSIVLEEKYGDVKP